MTMIAPSVQARGEYRPAADERPYQPIEDYALLSNCEGSALVARDGSIDWACLERFDAPPIFSRLLDRRRGGYFVLRPRAPFEVSRTYVGHTNILVTSFTTADGIVTLHDFMIGSQGDRARLIRMVTGVSGCVPMVACYRPLDGFATGAMPLTIEGGRVEAPNGLLLLADTGFEPEDDHAMAAFTMEGGTTRRFALHNDPGARALPDARGLMEEARRAWRDWATDSTYSGALVDEVTRSALVLKALTYAPTGAIVAAPTTSLPEEIGGIRNWDYRYCWIRDACLSFYTLKKFGTVHEAERFFDFVARLGTDEGLLRPLYSIDGDGDLTETEIAHFEGWRGSAPVRHGNEAAEQHQSDAYGQLLDLFYLYVRLGGTLPAAMCTKGEMLADIAAKRWEHTDAGLWEPRKPERRYLHAAMMNWVALDRAVRLFGERPHWVRERDRIVAFLNGEALAGNGYYAQYLGTDEPDAAVLVAPILGFPVDEAAFARTVDVVIERLGHDHLVYRYRNDDGLPGHEGTFLLCAFWLVDALLWLGRDDEARTRFEALRALQNDVGLYAEEVAEDGAFLGNFPQAFSHLGFIHSALLIDLFDHGGREALRGNYADRCLRETAARRAASAGPS